MYSSENLLKHAKRKAFQIRVLKVRKNDRKEQLPSTNTLSELTLSSDCPLYNRSLLLRTLPATSCPTVGGQHLSEASQKNRDKAFTEGGWEENKEVSSKSKGQF
jgi:hypothetical protein